MISTTLNSTVALIVLELRWNTCSICLKLCKLTLLQRVKRFLLLPPVATHHVLYVLLETAYLLLLSRELGLHLLDVCHSDCLKVSLRLHAPTVQKEF